MKLVILKIMMSFALSVPVLAPISVMILSQISATVHANDGFIGEPSYGGNGCPSGTASISVSPSGDSLSVLFDQQIAEAGGETGKLIDIKSCNISIPIQVPVGYTVSVEPIPLQGFLQIPLGGKVTITEEVYFAGIKGPSIKQNFNGPLSQDFLFDSQLAGAEKTWSPCGVSSKLLIRTSLSATTNLNHEATFGTLDSIGAASMGTTLRIQWKRCQI